MKLEGNWQINKMLVHDTALKIDYQIMKLQFMPLHRYSFTNNLNQTEAGIFEIKDSLLLLSDTTKTKIVERAIQIMRLSNDTLLLRQNFQGNEARLILTKIK